MRLLAGDIGGTNIRLRAKVDGHWGHTWTGRNEGQDSVMSALSTMVNDIGPFDGIGLGVAGPLVDETITMTNVAVSLHRPTLMQTFGCDVALMNDFYAQALAVLTLRENELTPLGPSRPVKPGNWVVLGAGTGLGEAFLVWDGKRHIPVAGEGSHARFAPKNEQEVGVLNWLMQQWPDHVSVERVVSGPGIINVYDALRGDTPRHAEMRDGDPAVVITQHGLAGTCAHCVGALQIFVDTLADEAASMALKCNASTVFISGGIPPRIRPLMLERFRHAFDNKGRYRSAMENIGTYLVTSPDAGLIGAAEAISNQLQ